MREIFGKQVYDSLREVVNPKHTAILVIDMQKDFCFPGGYFDKSGLEITAAQEILPNIIRLIDEGRKRGVKIVWIQNTTLKDGLSDSPGWLYQRAKVTTKGATFSEYTVEGTWGQEFVDGLHPQRGEPIIRKHRFSGFYDTDLDLILRSNGIEAVVIIGADTTGAIHSTAMDSCFHNYFTVTVSNCTFSPWGTAIHEGGLLSMGILMEIATSDDILEAWA
jgi:nicotinamidase-related amidase